MSRTVLVTDYAWPNLEIERRVLADIGAELVVAETSDEGELVELAGNADAILTNWRPVTARVLSAAPKCLTVARYGVGVDNIDVEQATELGIIVSNVPDYCIDEVSDHTIALILALARRIVDFSELTRAGGWDNQAFGSLHRMGGRTLGVIGFGRIGRLVARKARAFELTVITHAPSLSPGSYDGVEALPTVEELLERSDIISLHAPLTATTRHMIGVNELGRMRRGAFLVNTARGALLDIGAVLSALETGHLGGVGLDVLDEEPPGMDDPIRSTPGLVLTPHAAFYSAESVTEVQEKASANVVSVLNGSAPATTVNPAVLTSPSRRHPGPEA